MPNYIRTQNPWLTAANAMQGVVDPLNQAMLQVPRIRMQMQQHADEMGLRQAGLDLQQQEFVARQPYYIAQANAESQQAELYKQQALAQTILNSLAPQAQAAKRSAVQNEQGYVPGMPTRANMAILDNSVLAGILAASGGPLGQSSAATMLNNEQQPIRLNQNQTGFSRAGVPQMQGLVSAPLGNNVYAPQQVGMPQQTIQQGQFRPSLAQANPAASANNLANVMKVLMEADPSGGYMNQVVGGRTNQVLAPQFLQMQNVIQGLARQAGGTNTMAVPGTGVKIKSIKQIQ